MRVTTRFAPLVLACFLASCASHQRPLPKYEKPLSRAAVQSVRTTAYTDTESDHIVYGCNSATGEALCSGPINSAAADWSRWPAGTVFRIRETGELYKVDDYGWALSGTNTIDLYKPSRAAMNAWGVHRVSIELIKWGDVWRSYDVLKPRNKYAHVRRMLSEIEERYARNGRNISEPVVSAPATPPVLPPAVSAPTVRTVSSPPPVHETPAPRPQIARAQAQTAAPCAEGGFIPPAAASGVAANPFYRQ